MTASVAASAVDWDADLAGLAEARRKAIAARRAFEAFADADQADLDRIVAAMSAAASAASEELARLAVDETGYGVYEDKVLKNRYNADFVAESMEGMRTKGVLWVDEPGRMTAIGSPVGVIAAIIPVTNPTSTVIFKCLAAVKAGNAIVNAPHPRAVKCCTRAAEIMSEAAVAAGAPEGLISCLEHASIATTAELMQHAAVSLVLATGGAGMVAAAYRSGKPTLAVGAGNVPVYVDESVPDVAEASQMIITSKAFDNGTACVAEQSVVLDASIAEAFLAAGKERGLFLLEQSDQQRLSDVLFDARGGLRPEAVGQSAINLAGRMGITVPADTRVLGAELTWVGPKIPLSAEILGPVLTFYRTRSLDEAFERCREILAFGGEGHTLGLHASNDTVIARMSALPASRIPINTPSLFGGMGYSTSIGASFMLGTGTWSGSMVSDNVSALHLINIKRVAFEVRPWRDLYSGDAAARRPR
ncbi:MAG: acetaldehyde dehydrogenase [Nocardioides sp.]|jgi:acetaldehyde dehydrogenase (acetylating)|uniref:aldehyde dehydrogenase family protein n=1 Tax=Nocardioides sp. TaxID=35761 RepID=UPI00261AE8D8|nr:aldehyde dehydrogenase family protein [Nocardioides sp.]MCW2833325.1 acetaldehyde dehydrogenase [Nocardioides sp.]